MTYFADLITTSTTDTPVVVGALVTLVGGFFAIAKIMLSQASKDREADRTERQALSQAIKQMAKSSDKVAIATERSADEAKQRNGHLGELVSQGNEQLKVLVKANTQNVHEQNVEHLHVENVDKQVVN